MSISTEEYYEQLQNCIGPVLLCADSRVQVELVIDLTIGHLFVTRIAGNVATPEIIASLEYGVAVLGTEVILVMGHSNCGAVKATIHATEVPGEISALFPHIQPAVDLAGSNIEAATKTNAKIRATLLRDASTVISSFAKQGKVKVVAAYYDITSGAATLLDWINAKAQDLESLPLHWSSIRNMRNAPICGTSGEMKTIQARQEGTDLELFMPTRRPIE